MNEPNNDQAFQYSRILAPIFLLRLGIAFTFLYAGISSLLNPSDWIWYIPKFVESIVPASFALTSFSIVEIILGLWLLRGKNLKLAALVSTLILAGITLVSLNVFQVTFRDVGLTLSAFALFKLSEK